MTLRFRAQWKTAPEDEAFGPETSTWAHFTVSADGHELTSASSLVPFTDADALPIRDFVEGPLSGLAEWWVDHFVDVLWEFGVPFPKTRDALSPNVPGMSEAYQWWSRFSEVSDLGVVGRWQQRHTVGVAMTQLAIPSLVLVPEPDRIGLFVQSVLSQHDPNVRIAPSEGPIRGAYWLDRAELRDEIVQFVENVISRAAGCDDTAHWAAWLNDRWQHTKRLEQDPEQRLAMKFGARMSAIWSDQIANTEIEERVSGLLFDVANPRTDDDVNCVIKAASLKPTMGKHQAWRTLSNKARRISAPTSHDEGYVLAAAVREALDLGLDPIPRVDVVLWHLDVEDTVVPSRHLFRSASFVDSGKAIVAVSSENTSLAGQRTARAVALGRLLFDSRGDSWGAAFGPHSRWLETSRANAFAAELLAPLEIVKQQYLEAPDALADDYGISRTSAKWRVHNARHKR